MKKIIGYVASTSLITVIVLQGMQIAAQQSTRIRVNRWLEVRRISGSVTYLKGGASRRARAGDRVQAVGDGVRTGANSSVRLAVDTEVGLVTVQEKTTVRIQSLQVAPDNGRITRLNVSQGQVRVQVRPFTHRGSRLEVSTPSSVSGVRGTQFGIAVQPNGRTGLATLEGKVVNSAQGKSQTVAAGYQNLTMPGEAPSLPVPLRDDPTLTYSWQIVVENNIRKVRLLGQVDPVNLVFVQGKPQLIDRDGRFQVMLALPSSPRYQVIVTTPLGRSKTYDLKY